MTNIDDSTAAQKDSKKLIRLTMSTKELAEKTVIMYLFSKPKSNKLFLSKQHVDLKKLINSAKGMQNFGKSGWINAHAANLTQ